MKRNKLIFSSWYMDRYKTVYCDIGASGGLISPWNLFDKKNLRVIGFEPDEKAFAILNKEKSDDKFYNIGLWSTKSIQKYHIFKGGVSISSMYKPNHKLNNMHLEEFNIGREVEKTIDVPCDTLDNIIESENIPDYIKIDTQGSEYEILKGAKNLLENNSLLITTETWSEDYYKDTPTMDKIITLMMSYGYQLFTTELAIARKFKNKREIIDNSRMHLGGLELLFVKRFDKLFFDSEIKLINFIALLELYGHRSYAIYILENTKFIDMDLSNELLDKLYENAIADIQIYPKLR